MLGKTKILLLSILVIACTTKQGKQESMEAKEEKDNSWDLLVGTYTGDGSDGIYRLSFDPKTGDLSDLKLMAKQDNPSFLTISPDRNYVYSVGERDSGIVAAYKWNNETLQLVNKQSSVGANPCYIDIANGWVAASNYSSGNVVVYKVLEDGSLPSDPFNFQHEGKGPNEARQEGPHAHFSKFSFDGRYLYTVDLGIDQVIAYPVTKDSIRDGFVAFELEPGDGPRHIAFDNERNRAYIVTELSNVIVSVNVDPVTGMFEEVDRKSTLPETFEGESYCADIHLTSNGRFLYASNRGDNSISIFAVDDNGILNLQNVEPVKGDWPRNFTLSPDEKYLLVANQNSNNIVVFEVNSASGLLTATGAEIQLSHPVCLVF